MKYLSRLMALLCVMALFACGALAEGSIPLDETKSSYGETVAAAQAAVVALYNELMAAQSVEEMYALVLEIVNDEGTARYDTLMALSFDQLEKLRVRVYELDPELDDTDTADMLDMLSYLPNAICPDCGLSGEHEADCPRGQIMILPTSGPVGVTTISSSQSWNLTGDITLTGTITIKSGVKFGIFNNAAQKTVAVKRGNGFTGTMFKVEEGGSLQINGFEWNNGNWDAGNPTNGPVVIDGNGDATGNIIHCSGKLALRDTVIRNNEGQPAIYLSGSGAGQRYDDAHNMVVTVEITRTLIEKSSATSGGGIYIAYNTPADYSVDIWQSKIYQCTAIDASAIYFASAGQATVTMRNSVVDDCDTTTGNDGQYGGALRTNGNGRYKFSMTDSVLRNCDSWKFGGGIYWNASGEGSELLVSDCQFLNNTAAEMGGGMFLEGSNMIITASAGTPSEAYTGGIPGNLTGTLIQGNSAPNGGGISYKCYSNSSEVQVPNTVANFNENVIFNENRGTNGAALAYNLHDTHNYPTGAKFTFNINGAQFTDNVATGDGGAIYIYKCRNDYVCTVNFNSGTIANNTAKNGGAIAVTTANGITVGGTFNMKGGALENNTANANGGAVYLQNGHYNMSGGSAQYNEAVNGGAAYVTGGNFEMSNGFITYNSAGENGGAVYMGGGDFTLKHGVVNSNAATNGGAVYMAGETSIFKMESGSMDNNTAKKNAAGEGGDGGAVFANGGTLEIGLNGCAGSKIEIGDDGEVTIKDENASAHQTLHKCGTSCTHPSMTGNTAADSGGAIAIADEGAVRFYCGNAINNTALYKGVGKNVFMAGGHFYLYDGANVGAPRDPDLVIVGGELHNACVTKEMLDLFYYKNNTDPNVANIRMHGLVQKGEYFNITDAEYFWDAEAGYTFVGWTGKGFDSADTDKVVRNKNQYLPSGDSYRALDEASYTYTEDGEEITVTQVAYDGDSGDQDLHFYALWAPITNDITYVDSMTNTRVGTATYTLAKAETGNIVTIPAIEKPGYAVVGWYLYQDEGQNANWGLEPAYVEGKDKEYANLDYDTMKKVVLPEVQYKALAKPGDTLELDASDMRFGNITLVAEFKPMFSDLRIIKAGSSDLDPNQTYIFNVHGMPDDGSASFDTKVTIVGNASTLLKQVPVGTYTVTELTGWSWRYDCGEVVYKDVDDDKEELVASVENGITVPVSNPDKTVELTFTNTRDKVKWLDGNAETTENVFGKIPASESDESTDMLTDEGNQPDSQNADDPDLMFVM